MTPTATTTPHTQARAGSNWRFLHPIQSAELLDTYQRLDYAQGDKTKIGALIPLLLCAWEDHNREEERRVMREIERLCYTDIETKTVAEMRDLPIDNVGNP